MDSGVGQIVGLFPSRNKHGSHGSSGFSELQTHRGPHEAVQPGFSPGRPLSKAAHSRKSLDGSFDYHDRRREDSLWICNTWSNSSFPTVRISTENSAAAAKNFPTWTWSRFENNCISLIPKPAIFKISSRMASRSCSMAVDRNLISRTFARRCSPQHSTGL